jgi:hypothetical protein
MGVGSWTIQTVLLSGPHRRCYLSRLDTRKRHERVNLRLRRDGARDDFSLALGLGLIALLFYSSRKGYDEPPVLIAPEYDAMESKDVPEAK